MSRTNRIGRLGVTAALATATAFSGLSLGGSAAADDVDAQGVGNRHSQRAEAAYDALQSFFYDPATSLYLEAYPHPGGNPYSYVWPFSQALVGTLDLTGIPGTGKRYRDDLADRFAAIEGYWNAGTIPPGYDSYLRPPLGQGGDKFYDDNEWIALSLIQQYKMTGDRSVLPRAKEIFDLVTFGWDNDPSHPCPGGVYWTQAPWSQDRNTVSNAPGAEVGLHLYQITGKKSYLDWAKRMYEWTRGCLLAPNGLYWDNIKLDGSIDKTQWTYNQGTMIGAGVLLYKATGDRTYLRQAKDTAAAALAFYAEGDRIYTQDVEFNAIFFSNLLQLNAVAPNPAYRQAVESYADGAHDRFRDPATGLYHYNANGEVTLLEQSAIVRIEAMLAWNQKDHGKLT